MVNGQYVQLMYFLSAIYNNRFFSSVWTLDGLMYKIVFFNMIKSLSQSQQLRPCLHFSPAIPL